MLPQNEIDLAWRVQREAERRSPPGYVTPVAADARFYDETWTDPQTGLRWIYVEPGDWCLDLTHTVTGYLMLDAYVEARSHRVRVHRMSDGRYVVELDHVLRPSEVSRGVGGTIGIAAAHALLTMWRA